MEQKRKNWFMCFVTLVLVSGLAGGVLADDVEWDGGGSNNYWTTPENWVGDALPTGNHAMFYNSSVPQPLVCDGVTASAYGFYLSSADANPCILDVTGGSLTITNDKMVFASGNGGEGILNMSGGSVLACDGIIVGNWNAASATFNMSGGTFTSQVLVLPGTGWWDQFCVGNEIPGTLNMSGGAIIATGDMILSRANGSSTVNMTGGTIDIAGIIHASYGNKKPVEFNLDGGVVTAGELVMKSRGRLYLTEGVMILDGDVTVLVQEYIDDGQITAYGYPEAVIVDYNNTNPGKTTITGDPDFNVPPVVDAGKYQSILSLEAQMDPCVSDDGMPVPPSLTYTWSGPDGVTFDPCNTVEAPIAMFTAAGFYELQLSVSDGDKDACDVVTIYVRANDDPIAHWKFEEGTGGSAVLDDVNDNDGVIAGDLEPNWVSGWVGDWAMEFYASGETTVSSYVDITSDVSAADPNLDSLRYDITLSAWFKIGDLAVTDYPIIVANGDDGWRLYVNHSDGTVVFTPGDGVADWQDRTTSTKLLDDGYWHHVVGMYDYANSKSYLYIDGNLDPCAVVVSEDHTGMMAYADDKPVTIGARWKIVEEALVAERGWNGMIDDVRVYSYCISEATIAELADMGDLIPLVEAGENQTVSIQEGAVQLAGTATDDGKPNPSLDIEWTKISGPAGTLVFDPSNTVEAPAVTFPSPEEEGTDVYVLRLTADDGQTVISDEVTITVNNPICQNVVDGEFAAMGDISGPEGKPDCYVNLYDFAALAGNWLYCNDPQNSNCEFIDLY